jgi:hypothetical protein
MKIYAQQDDFVCKGVVLNTAKELLQDVRIYYRDTIPVYTNQNGEFQIQLKKGDKLHFRKSGYAWHTREITDNATEIILKPNKVKKVDENTFYDTVYTEIIYDGKLVPDKEFYDAFSTDHSEIAEFGINGGYVVQTQKPWEKPYKDVTQKSRIFIKSIYYKKT